MTQDLDQVNQRQEWLAARAGKATASRIADIMAKTKTGYSASRDNYRAELVVQRLTGRVEEGYSNAAMQWGTEQEPVARSAYEALMGSFVLEVGFYDHPTIEMSGASPDGLVGVDGLIEIKCPQAATFLEYIQTKEPPRKYVLQMQWQMACTGRKWCDFVAFHPYFPTRLQLLIVRVQRDDALIAEIESEVKKFLSEVQSTVDVLKEKA